MRVLHVTPWKLPDIRVERAILSDIYNGFEVHLAAPGIDRFDLPVPKDRLTFHEIKFTLLDKAGYRISKRKLKRIVEKVSPDVIHAHDFPAAYLAKGLAPMVYDAHEDRASTAYRRGMVKLESLFGPLARLLSFIAREYARKNLEALKDVVVVAPSQGIVDRFVSLGARKGFVLPNFPHKLEVPKIELTISQEPIHAAVDRPKYLVYGHKYPRRRPVEGFPKFFEKGIYGKLLFAGGKLEVKNVISLGFVPHMKLYELMKHARTLLVPRRPYRLHKDISPNRVYTLAQAGLVPVVPYTLKQVLEYIPESISFKDDEEFREIVEGISNEDPENRMKRKQRVFERAKSVRRLDEVQKAAYKEARSGKCLLISDSADPQLIISKNFTAPSL